MLANKRKLGLTLTSIMVAVGLSRYIGRSWSTASGQSDERVAGDGADRQGRRDLQVLQQLAARRHGVVVYSLRWG